MNAEIFGTDTCPDCTALKAWLAEHPELTGWTWVDITGSTAALKRFLRLRDTENALAGARARHTIGIPCYRFADGVCLLDGEAARARLAGR